MMNNNFKIPNMGVLTESVDQINRADQIISNIYGYDKISRANQIIKINEAYSEAVTSLESVLDEYASLLESGRDYEADELLESEGATAIATDEGEVILEKVKTVIHADGSKEKVKVKTHKKKLKGKRLAAVRKAMKKLAKNPKVKKNRMKALKKRRKKMGESYDMIESIMSTFESSGTPIDRSVVSRLVNEARLSESAENLDVEDHMATTLEDILNNKGLEVTEFDSLTEDGVTALDVTVIDTDADIYLGEIADELGETLDCEVDYDEPIPSEEDESKVNLTFYMIPCNELKESCGGKKKCNEEDDDEYECSKTEKCKSKSEKCNSSKKNMNEGDHTEYEDIKCPKCGKKKVFKVYVKGKWHGDYSCEACDYEFSKSEVKNESFSLAGCSDNIRCKLNPAFIRAGQLIYDEGHDTVFKALTESVESNGDFALTIDVLNSSDSKLAGISGAEVRLTPDDNYFLLKSNPLS